METTDTIIIGGGLSGVYAAYLLAQKGTSFILLEARKRLGGRILSPNHNGFFSDLGPSWYWPEIHPEMAGLIQMMQLHGYRQFETGNGRFQRADGAVRTVGSYAMQPQSWRLAGGMAALVDKLYEAIPENTVRLSHPVCEIRKEAKGVRVGVGDLEADQRTWFGAPKVILALPPRLAAATILFTPELPHDLTQAMLSVGTWMAGQAKFCVLYDQPFWQEAGLSGQAFSECGPLGEIHDASNDDQGPYGLTGFVGLPAARRSQFGDLTEPTLFQLAGLFGESANRPSAVFYRDWAKEHYTATIYDQPPMTHHPVYQPPAGQTAIWDGTVHFAGTETADQHGGYLEGALNAAQRAVSAL